ncbi:MAG: SCP2 sterol-binding domain-containing protein [Acidimicrobiales bacterium]|nr:SCP2 sterol-binding domain-containing protein [Acidimicrobiales bacterium]
MTRFLSPEWLAELDAAVASHPRLAELTEAVRIVVEQRITGTDLPAADLPATESGDDRSGETGEVVYHVVLDHGVGSVVAGPAVDPTVTFTQDVSVARAIAAGEESAQRAFMSGDLRVGGNLLDLTAHQGVLVELGDVFAAVRAATDFEAAAEG